MTVGNMGGNLLSGEVKHFEVDVVYFDLAEFDAVRGEPLGEEVVVPQTADKSGLARPTISN